MPIRSYDYAPVLPVNVSRAYFSTSPQGAREKLGLGTRLLCSPILRSAPYLRGVHEPFPLTGDRASRTVLARGLTLFTDSEVRHVRCDYVMHYSSVGKVGGFTLFTDSEVGHVRCDYVMHYSSVCKRGKVGVSETQKSKVRAKFM